MRKLMASFVTLVTLGPICAVWVGVGDKTIRLASFIAANGQHFSSARKRGSTARLISLSASAYSNTVVR